MAATILALNAGSSSLKFALFDGAAKVVRLRGSVSSAGQGAARFETTDAEGRSVADERWDGSVDDRLERLVRWLETHLGGDELVAAGHRVVHGGAEFSAPAVVNASVLAALEGLTPLAPLHQPGSLQPIHQLSAIRPNLLQVACFDTAFHHGLTPPASRYALPRALEAEGIRRYGFHGLSYESIAASLRRRGDGADHELVVVAHLGSGASLCAMKALRSLDTTMGFSALDGLVMGTRPGALDPGLLLYLQREKGYDLDRLEHLLYHESGLLGVSTTTSDVQELLASDRPEAGEALDLFAFSAARNIVMMATTLGGLDRVVFTGGIGEHAWQVRERIGRRLEWIGLKLDREANMARSSTISAIDSAVRVDVVPTDEEAVIARHVATLLHDGAHRH